jgi:hypothetical protein
MPSACSSLQHARAAVVCVGAAASAHWRCSWRCVAGWNRQLLSFSPTQAHSRDDAITQAVTTNLQQEGSRHSATQQQGVRVASGYSPGLPLAHTHTAAQHTLVTIVGLRPRRAAAVSALAQLPPPCTCARGQRVSGTAAQAVAVSLAVVHLQQFTCSSSLAAVPNRLATSATATPWPSLPPPPPLPSTHTSSASVRSFWSGAGKAAMEAR